MLPEPARDVTGYRWSLLASRVVAMVNECPVCRHPVNGARFLLRRTVWTCPTCGSLLNIDKNRRYLALIPCAAVTLVGVVFLTRSGWGGDWTAVPVAFAAWLSVVLLLDRANVLERRGFWCRQCGYDLRGQVDPHCPECGRDFDSNETAQMELSDPTRLVQGQERKRGYLGLILFIALTLALTVPIILSVAVYRRAKSTSVSPALTQPSITAPDMPGDQPENN